MISRLDLYKVFAEVVKYKNFSHAAKELFMTQPAVSMSIMQLEKDLDTRLFTRTSKGVNLTNDGELLFQYINSAISLIKTGEEKLLESKNLLSGELKIGVGDTISRYFLLPYLEQFHNTYEKIKLKIINRTTLELINMVKSGEVDIAICNLPIDDNAIEVKKCIEVSDVFVCGEKYKYLLERELSLEDIMSLPLILLEPKSNSRQYVEKYVLSQGFKLNPEIELGSHDLLLEFAKINLGISCVVKEFSMDYLESGILHQLGLKKEIPNRSIGYCFLKSVILSPASKKFVEIIEHGRTTNNQIVEN